MEKKKHKNIPIFVPHIGCPNDCSFCNQKKITGVESAITPEKAHLLINDSLKNIGEAAEVEIAFFGGSFTGIEKEYRRALLEVANRFLKEGRVSGIRLSSRPDYIDDDILCELLYFGVTDVELGVQSMDDEVLALNRRGHTKEDAKRAALKIKQNHIRLGLQMMPGLFGDTKEKTIYTAREIAKLLPDCVRIYPTVVLKDTYLDELYKDGKFVPLSIEEAVSVCAEIVPIFKEKGINIIRMGLMASDSLAKDGNIVSGPFHPAFGELVLSELLYNKAVFLTKEIMGDVNFCVNPKTLSAFIGNKRKNIKRLQEKLGGNINVYTNDKYDREEVTFFVP